MREDATRDSIALLALRGRRLSSIAGWIGATTLLVFALWFALATSGWPYDQGFPGRVIIPPDLAARWPMGEDADPHGTSWSSCWLLGLVLAVLGARRLARWSGLPSPWRYPLAGIVGCVAFWLFTDIAVTASWPTTGGRARVMASVGRIGSAAEKAAVLASCRRSDGESGSAHREDSSPADARCAAEAEGFLVLDPATLPPVEADQARYVLAQNFHRRGYDDADRIRVVHWLAGMTGAWRPATADRMRLRFLVARAAREASTATAPPSLTVARAMAGSTAWVDALRGLAWIVGLGTILGLGVAWRLHATGARLQRVATRADQFFDRLLERRAASPDAATASPPLMVPAGQPW